MDKERSDKGTVRELTEIAENIVAAREKIEKAIRIARVQIEDGRQAYAALSDLTDVLIEVMSQLEKQVKSFDQRDRLEKDKAE
jgi:hypothetical protein